MEAGGGCGVWGGGVEPGLQGVGQDGGHGDQSAPLTLESLPTDPLLLILSFLDYRDLINCCYVS